ncbi:sensor histidine kinase [Sulfurirhabdus autotrophica]|uniref:histidine kinase n=1 Tax=Sulfurirhabdus autotrophica TaxID=1706046 RepID=A0A4R3YGJ6_9PROT|nr:sensor histidine kinase [Sulfurirhabdus autotrophica]TCV89683.1 two-component system sensor histidine kinase TctE [Sulfurirhabdus autotrophica]
MFSIRVNLLKWLIAPLLVINLIGAGLAYWLAWVPAQIAFDQSLADTAWALIPQLHGDKGSISIDLPRQAEQILRVDYFDAIYFTVRNSKGDKIAGDNDFPSIRQPENLNNPETYDGSMRGEPVRIIALKTLVDSEPVYIGVAETLRKRNHIRSVIFVALLLLEGLITLVSFAVVWLAVTKGLLPLNKLQTDLNARSHNDLSSLTAENIPLELHPVVNAINNLLNKVHIGVSGQQNFLANVTHQLRTPLAGLKMQLEWLQQRYASDQETAHSAELMMSSTDRMIRQTNQLLALARAEPTQFEETRLKLTPLNTLVEESIQHFVEEADKKKIDLGFNLHPTQVMGDDFLLRDMIDNIIDNAIRYTPEKGTITVSCIQTTTESVFSVEDTGPGIPESERELIFNRFYRLDDSVAGSGLGLAIVRDIVKDHGATISITAGAHGKGSIFSVHFPL